MPVILGSDAPACAHADVDGERQSRRACVQHDGNDLVFDWLRTYRFEGTVRAACTEPDAVYTAGCRDLPAYSDWRGWDRKTDSFITGNGDRTIVAVLERLFGWL